MIRTLELTNFTVFERAKMQLSPRINVIIGANSTGKTHVLKSLYSIAGHEVGNLDRESEKKEAIAKDVSDRLLRAFMPHEDKLGRLRRTSASGPAEIAISFADDATLTVSFNSNSKRVSVGETATGLPTPVLIPTKEVLSFSKGFTSLYEKYSLSFDQTYFDICNLLDLPERRADSLHEKSKWAIEEIERVCGGKFIFYGGGNVTFKTTDAEYSANAMAEGFRKAGMLSRLLQTGAIQPGQGGVLLWDEPETNLNPRLMGLLVEILLELSRQGQQIVIATHEYVILKWFDLLSLDAEEDHILYHSLHVNESGSVSIATTENYLQIQPNPIADTFEELTKAQLQKQISGEAK